MEIYLDNAATTKTLPVVNEAMMEVLEQGFGNPSSKHILGVNAEKYIKDATNTISKILKCNPKEIVYTSCATESNNTAIFGSALKRERFGKHLITSQIEHPSVKEAFLELEDRGFRVTFLPVDSKGKVDIEALKEALDEETTFVSIMTANNEIGTVQDIETIGNIVKDYNKDIIFHTDAVQAFGKIPIDIKAAKVDILSVSAHKLHGPKGIGFLYKRNGVNIPPYLYGGGQQSGQRSGTEPVFLIYGMSVAIDKAFEGNTAIIPVPKHMNNIYELREYFINGLKSMENVYINGYENAETDREKYFLPNIVSATFDGVRAEVLLHALEEKGIYVSSGSACSSNKPGLSSVIQAIGVDKDKQDSNIRFSMDEHITKEDIDYVLDTLKEQVPFLRQFTRR